jgi:hypothetical protein
MAAEKVHLTEEKATGPGLPGGYRVAARLMKAVPGMAKAAAFYRLGF